MRKNLIKPKMLGCGMSYRKAGLMKSQTQEVVPARLWAHLAICDQCQAFAELLWGLRASKEESDGQHIDFYTHPQLATIWLRLCKKWTIIDMATYFMVTDATINSWLSGRRKPSGPAIRLIVHLLEESGWNDPDRIPVAQLIEMGKQYGQNGTAAARSLRAHVVAMGD